MHNSRCRKREVNFQFGLLSPVSAAANKIHILLLQRQSAHSNFSYLLPRCREPGRQGKGGKGRPEKGRKRRNSPRRPTLPPALLLVLIKENPSVISPPSRRSKPHGRAIMFKCETITTGRRAVQPELQQCSSTHLTLPLRWELPASWGRSRMAAPKYHNTEGTSNTETKVGNSINM